MSNATEGLTINQLAERNAEHVTTIESLRNQLTALTSQLESVVAENAALKKYICDECYVENIKTGAAKCAGLGMPETPATDVFLAEVRASGADEVSAICRGLANKDGCSVNMQCSYNLTAERAEAVAAKLRKGSAL